MLYPTLVSSIDSIQGMNALDNSSLNVVPFSIASGKGIQFFMTQLSPTQDYSIRAWVSLSEGGNFIPTNASFWHLNRSNDQAVLIYDLNGQPPVGNIHLIPLLVGNYFLNILNLVNAENVFSFSSVSVDC